jgi:Fe-Mn family superoxide dismutase
MRELLELVESRSGSKLELKKLRYSRSSLSPVFTELALNRHLDLAKGYVERYNDGEGDASFNEAGAFLHNLFFEQFKTASSNNRPAGPVNSLIIKKYGSFGDFKEQFTKAAMAIQGSGWIYLARNGEIKTIKNHAKRTDILLLVDWWEHAWVTDYGTNKKKYLENIWRIIQWGVVNSRL